MTVATEVHPESKAIDNPQNVCDFNEEDMKPVVNTLGFVLCFSYIACLVAVLGIIEYDFFTGFNIYNFFLDKYFIDDESNVFIQVIKWLSFHHQNIFISFLSGLSILVEIVFYAVVLILPKYSFLGNKFVRALPLLASSVLYGCWGFIIDKYIGFCTLAISAVAFAIKYAIFAMDNGSDSMFLALKPWVFIKGCTDEESAGVKQ